MNRRALLAAGSALGLGAVPGVALAAPSGQLPSRAEVLAVLQRVNDRWIAANPSPGNNQWARATYFSGNMAHYRVSGTRRYLDYAVGCTTPPSGSSPTSRAG